ncbi:cyclin-A3-2-like [Tripterygium wilfordii]|uniref:cyclin-A3-2-like n=1 Tax=Tripterygium wilfordii TaxID=458696 RepID=UPI0018F7F2F0|nr:cyclin-A3-2-like [Tripterygium wilfordii]
MADQENVRITRTAKRRAAGNTEDMPVPKKRVVLGELPNVSNVVVSVNPSLGNEPQKRKSRAKTKAKKALVSTTAKSTTEDVAEKVDIDGESHDPQMCAPYATDIYDYLHKMEVHNAQVLPRVQHTPTLRVLAHTDADMKLIFFELTLNVVMKMVWKKRYVGENEGDVEEAGRFKEIVTGSL